MRTWSPTDLAPLLGAPDRAAVLLDFDGTLAPIVEDPATARPIAGAGEVLARLARRYRLVAVISGRPGRWLAEHLDVPGVERWGSYGLERVVGESIDTDPAAASWQSTVAEVGTRARAEAPAGVRVEDKGVSLTIHVRAVPEQEAWAREFAARESQATGLAVHDAKMSVELRPPLSADKGVVVGRLLEGAGVEAACYVGDDLGDLSAFGALGGVRTALRVAVLSAEAPAELVAAADVVVEGPGGVLELLRALGG